jgi:hypothetical protein
MRRDAVLNCTPAASILIAKLGRGRPTEHLQHHYIHSWMLPHRQDLSVGASWTSVNRFANKASVLTTRSGFMAAENCCAAAARP